MNTDIIRRLATSQARGTNQLSFVNELINMSEVPYYWYTVPTYQRYQTRLYGITRLDHSSWKNLKARLVSVGFVIKDDKENMTISLIFPEARG